MNARYSLVAMLGEKFPELPAELQYQKIEKMSQTQIEHLIADLWTDGFKFSHLPNENKVAESDSPEPEEDYLLAKVTKEQFLVSMSHNVSPLKRIGALFLASACSGAILANLSESIGDKAPINPSRKLLP
jgi:hypothetical protein